MPAIDLTTSIGKWFLFGYLSAHWCRKENQGIWEKQIFCGEPKRYAYAHGAPIAWKFSAIRGPLSGYWEAL